MSGDQRPSGGRPPKFPRLLPPKFPRLLPPKFPRLLPPINDDDDASPGLRRHRDSGPQPPISSTSDSASSTDLSNPTSPPTTANAAVSSSSGPLAHWPSEDPKLRPPISSSPAFAAAASSSSSSSPLGRRPSQDPNCQPPIAAAPWLPIYIVSEDLSVLDSLGIGPRQPIVISPEFPLEHLYPLCRRIVHEKRRPPELRTFEVLNPDLLDKLGKKFVDLLEREEDLADHESTCRRAIRMLREATNMFPLVMRIPLDGIHLQIAELNAAINDLEQQRSEVRKTLGR